MTTDSPVGPKRSSGREAITAVLDRRRPERMVYAPNYWQWFEHQSNHSLPPEIAQCQSQLELIRGLGLDVFSRNIYSPQQTGWFGGLAEVVWTDVVCQQRETRHGRDRVFERTYRTRKGTLTERQRYVFDQSTLVQDKFLVDDPAGQIDALEELVRGRRWRFLADRYRAIDQQLGDDGLVIAGELFSPLKLLHMAMNPVESCYFLVDAPQLRGRPDGSARSGHVGFGAADGRRGREGDDGDGQSRHGLSPSAAGGAMLG